MKNAPVEMESKAVNNSLLVKESPFKTHVTYSKRSYVFLSLF